jgi:hypothetical protein
MALGHNLAKRSPDAIGKEQTPPERFEVGRALGRAADGKGKGESRRGGMVVVAWQWDDPGQGQAAGRGRLATRTGRLGNGNGADDTSRISEGPVGWREEVRRFSAFGKGGDYCRK